MEEIKAKLTIILPGRTMIPKEKCTKGDYDSFQLKVLNDKRKLETHTIYTRKCIPAKEVINISKESFKYMTAKSKKAQEDKENCPSFATPKEWFMLSRKERLLAHFKFTAQTLGGEDFEYIIFED